MSFLGHLQGNNRRHFSMGVSSYLSILRSHSAFGHVKSLLSPVREKPATNVWIINSPEEFQVIACEPIRNSEEVEMSSFLSKPSDSKGERFCTSCSMTSQVRTARLLAQRRHCPILPTTLCLHQSDLCDLVEIRGPEGGKEARERKANTTKARYWVFKLKRKSLLRGH